MASRRTRTAIRPAPSRATPVCEAVAAAWLDNAVSRIVTSDQLAVLARPRRLAAFATSAFADASAVVSDGDAASISAAEALWRAGTDECCSDSPPVRDTL